MTSPPGLSPGQQLALQQLAALETPAGLEVLTTHVQPLVRRLDVTISLPTAGIEPGPGIQLNARERFILSVSTSFPFAHPTVTVTHTRWAKTPHVQWGTQLCLYAAPSIEWQPAEGMRGLIERLVLWLVRAASGTLDGGDLPIHPPVAYADGTHGTVVVRADLNDRVPWEGPAPDRPTLLVALCRQDRTRLDVVRWTDTEHCWQDVRNGTVATDENGTILVAAAAVILPDQVSFEYPRDGGQLLAALEQQGVVRAELLALMGLTAHMNETSAPARGVPTPEDKQLWPHGAGGVPQVVLVGSPSREPVPGVRRAHLVAWRLDALAGAVSAILGSSLAADHPLYAELVTKCEDFAAELLESEPAHWCRVMDDRAEVTHRRDGTSTIASWHGRPVLILGCGALGGPVAEMLVRAGANVTVVDSGVVTPGILVRQPYTDAQVGQSKATALAERLRTVRHGASANDRPDDAVALISTLSFHSDPYDLVIDATADAAVRAALELHRTGNGADWPPLLTLLVGRDARRGVLAVSHTGASGGGLDVLRKLGTVVRSTHAAQLKDVADDLYPLTPNPDVFVPEPGCSSPTFRGSQMEATALGVALLSAGLDALNGDAPAAAHHPMAVAVLRLDHNESQRGAPTWIGWPNDHTARSQDGLQVRISPTALATIRAEARRGARLRGKALETGGMLLGALDEAAGVVYVDVATPPSPDSRCSAMHFEHGTVGTQALVDYYLKRTGRLSTFIGMWHTHPGGEARPSPTDEAGMANLVTPVLGGPARSLMLIAGGTTEVWDTWLRDDTVPAPDLYTRVVRRLERHTPASGQPPAPAGVYVLAEPATPEPDPASWWRRWLGIA